MQLNDVRPPNINIQQPAERALQLALGGSLITIMAFIIAGLGSVILAKALEIGLTLGRLIFGG